MMRVEQPQLRPCKKPKWKFNNASSITTTSYGVQVVEMEDLSNT